KGVGRVYQQTFIDTYAKVACAKLYDRSALSKLEVVRLGRTQRMSCDEFHVLSIADASRRSNHMEQKRLSPHDLIPFIGGRIIRFITCFPAGALSRFKMFC